STTHAMILLGVMAVVMRYALSASMVESPPMRISPGEQAESSRANPAVYRRGASSARYLTRTCVRPFPSPLRAAVPDVGTKWDPDEPPPSFPVLALRLAPVPLVRIPRGHR